MKLAWSIAALLAFAPTTVSATTYDAFSSFNGVNNPVGRFAYYSGGQALVAPSGTCTDQIANVQCLVSALPGNDSGVYKSPTVATLSGGGGTDNLHVTNTALLIQPGGSNGVGTYFIAPAAGTYFIDALFNAQDSLANGVSIFGVTGLNGVFSSNLIGNADFIPLDFTYHSTVSLGANDVFGFFLSPGAVDSHDITALNFTVNNGVPEPATWMMMLAGFGAIGLAMRRRQRITQTA